METVRKGLKKKDKKPIYILLGFLVFFCVFIYLITRPSIQTIALKELDTSFNKKDIETVWIKYKADLYHDEVFLLATREKLDKLNLSEDEKNDCISWLPPAPISENIVVIPDLSRRIIDTINNPQQIRNDIFVLKSIWESFVKLSKLKQDSKDKLMIDVTDPDQAKGQFSKIANDLRFDLAIHKGKSNILYFTADKDKQFVRSVEEMYKLAKSQPLGADYRYYFKRYLASRLKKSTLFDTYINKIVIITDGYLETEGNVVDTKFFGYEKILYTADDIGNILGAISSNGLNIPKVNIDLSSTSILVCEVNARSYIPFTKIPSIGKNHDYEVLKSYWQDWLLRMGVKDVNFKFIAKEQAIDITKKSIEDFIEN